MSTHQHPEFEHLRSKSLESLNLTVEEYRHRQTGAQHIHLASNNNENLFKIILKATKILSIVGFFPFVIVIIWGPWLFLYVFGSSWDVAGEYARWLSLLMFFMFISRAVIAAIPVLKMQQLFFIFELFSFSARAIGIFFGFFLYSDDVIAVAIFSLIGSFIYVVLIFIVLIISKRTANSYY